MQLKVAYLITRDSQRRAGIGDCIVVTFDEDFEPPRQGPACIVIDGGYSKTAKILKDYLKDEVKVKDIDLLVATHVDDDHISGLNTFIANYVQKGPKFAIHNYWGPAPKGYAPISTTEFIAMVLNMQSRVVDEMSFVTRSIDRNETLMKKVCEVVPEGKIYHPSMETRDGMPQIFKSVRLDLLAPDKQIAAEKIQGHRVAELKLGHLIGRDEGIDLADAEWEGVMNDAALENNRTANNQSIVFKLVPLGEDGEDIEAHSFLFSGDAEHESWEEIIRVSGSEIKAKYLKISHHGSHTGTTADILNGVNPNYGVICAGRNIHGLPDKEVLALIRRKGVKFYCTGRNPKPGESPCAAASKRRRCPRWNNAAAKEVLTPIVFEVDTARDTPLIHGNPCPIPWS